MAEFNAQTSIRASKLSDSHTVPKLPLRLAGFGQSERHRTAVVVEQRRDVALWPILLQKSFCGGERKFLEPLIGRDKFEYPDYEYAPLVNYSEPSIWRGPLGAAGFADLR